MILRTAVAVLIVMAGVESCGPTRPLMKEPLLPADEVVKRVEERNASIRTVDGSGSITVESPEQSSSGSFSLLLKKPDSLRVELNGPFGIRVGTLMLSRDQFLYYNRMDNSAVVGKPDGSTLNSLFRIRLKFDEVLHAFTGEFPSPAGGDTLEKFGVENGLYLLRYHGGDCSREYLVDPDGFVVTGYRMIDSTGKTAVTMSASDLDQVDHIAMPRLLRVVFPHEKRSVTIAYNDLQFNEPVICRFDLPRKADLIHR